MQARWPTCQRVPRAMPCRVGAPSTRGLHAATTKFPPAAPEPQRRPERQETTSPPRPDPIRTPRHGVPELHLHRDPPRHPPPAARRLPPLRLLQEGVLHLPASQPPGIPPRDNLRSLCARRRRPGALLPGGALLQGGVLRRRLN